MLDGCSHANAWRKAGLRPVEFWVPDTRRPGFAEEWRRQSRLVAEADQADTVVQHFMDETLAKLDGRTSKVAGFRPIAITDEWKESC